MPISTRGRSSNVARRRALVTARSGRTRQSGFTLLEVLVVVVIIAILTTIGVMSIGVLGGDRQRASEVERFEDVAATAIQEAELEGRDFGVRIQAASYEVYVYSPRRNRWEAVRDDRLYAVHTLPPGLHFALTLEGREVKLDESPPSADDVVTSLTETKASDSTDQTHAATKPQLLFYASGDVSPYHLELRRDQETVAWTIDEAADGTLKDVSPERRALLEQSGGTP